MEAVMNIANNILKHSLQNVYFLTGTMLAGKTTMSKALAEKHGFT
jgi:tRNA A37 threonylcarbamoyladenosine biosynthesis protein TsaE